MRRVALFIDAENLPACLSGAMIEEAARQGCLIARRVYGDFSRPFLGSWINIAPRHALTVCQTVAGAAGKNGADIALVIDAMEMLCRNEADIFCLATSDSDFVQLAMRMRQRGKIVIGLGRAEGAARFREACDGFVVLAGEKTRKGPPAVAGPQKLQWALLQKAMQAATSCKDGWVDLSELAARLRTLDPAFDLKTYGHGQFHKLLAFSGAELTADHRRARLKPALKVVAAQSARA